MERHVAYKLAVEIVVAQTTVLPVAYQEKRLIVACVDCQTMATVA
jgi:hypothetical protein